MGSCPPPRRKRGGGTAVVTPSPPSWQRDAATLQPGVGNGRGPKGVYPATSQALNRMSARPPPPTRDARGRAVVGTRRVQPPRVSAAVAPMMWQ